MSAIQLIDQAGTAEREELWDYMHSGNLTWDGIVGPYQVLPNGYNDMTGVS